MNTYFVFIIYFENQKVMTKSFIHLLLCCFLFPLLSVDGVLYGEKYRLQVHYSPPFGWTNDPNGLIYAFGAYQMYYQNNPQATKPGTISWGHAKSTDLIHWQHLPTAIPAFGVNSIFSGCAVLDRENLTGVIPFSSIGVVPLIAFYTQQNDRTEIQSQAMAYSLDRGLTFTQYQHNPIIPGKKDFRDPNIFVRNGRFLMTLVAGSSVQFWSSQNLLTWTFVSDFGRLSSVGDRSGNWECPSMIKLTDEQGIEHDLLLISVDSNTNVYGKNEYFIGKWDGTTFRSQTTQILRIDNGFDNYAGVPYHNDPLGRVIFIAWMSNFKYAPKIPTSGWRGQYTIPRELFLITLNGNLFLGQRPIKEFFSLIDATRTWSLKAPLKLSHSQTMDLSLRLPFKFDSLLTLEYSLDIKHPIGGKIGFRFGNKLGEFVSFYYDVSKGIYVLDRSRSGAVSFSPVFAKALVATVKRKTPSSSLTGRIILDTASIEIFADNGVDTFSAQFFPSQLYDSIHLDVNLKYGNVAEFAVVNRFTAAALKSIWQ